MKERRGTEERLLKRNRRTTSKTAGSTKNGSTYGEGRGGRRGGINKRVSWNDGRYY